MKILLFGDLHYRESRIADCEKVLDEVYRIAGENEAGMIVNVGDTFHDKGLIRTACLESYFRKRKMFEGFKWVDLVGNHDQDDAGGVIHPLSAFGLFRKSVVINDSYHDKENDILFVSYRKDMEKFLESQPKTKVLITHTGISGAFMNDTKQDTTGVSLKALKRYQRVFSGHYHKPHEFGNVVYVGSPMQQSFGEAGQIKSMVIYNTESDEFTRSRVRGLPEHHVIKVRWLDGEPQIDKSVKTTENDFVKIDMKGEIENVRSMPRSKFDFIKCRSLRIESEIDEVHISRLGVSKDELDDESVLFEKYVDFVNPDLDRKRLLDAYKELRFG